MKYAGIQEMFNAVYLGLASQGFNQSMDEEKVCVMRGVGGRKCAVGWLIPDSMYTPRMDFVSTTLESILQEVAGAITPENMSVEMAVEFLDKMIDLHDANCSPSEMKAAFKDYANCYGLTTPE